MIDVPVPVKNALKDGRRRKNHRFKVYNTEVVPTYTDLATLSNGNSYVMSGVGEVKLRLYSAQGNTGFGLTLTGDASVGEYIPADPSKDVTDYEFTLTLQSSITITINLSDYALTLQRVTEEEQEVSFTIDNDTLVSESVKYDERMCSGDTIKFGLCEGSSLEFQYFNHPNIYGRRVEGFIDVEWQKPFKEGIKPFVWNNVTYLTATNGTFNIVGPGEFKLVVPEYTYFELEYTQGGETITDTYYPVGSEETVTIGALEVGDYITATSDDPDFSVLVQGKVDWYTIPMGTFYINKCSRQASTGIKKASGYNLLQSDYLDAKANTVLADSFSDDFTLSIFDIRRTLLRNYNIITNDKQFNPTAGQPGGSVSSRTTALGSFKLNCLYGVDSPLNAYTWSVSSTGTAFDINLDASQYIFGYGLKDVIEARYGTLEGLERNVWAFVKNIINGAILDRTWSDVASYIATHDGFQQFFGVETVTEGGSPVRKKYSTLQWEYEEENGLPHTVAGPIADIDRLCNTEGMWRAYINIPHAIVKGSTSLYIQLTGGTYRYYTNAGLSTLSPQMTYDSAKFSDGTDYFMWRTEGTETRYALQPVEYTLDPADEIEMQISSIPDFTLREIQSGVFETLCQFGHLDRVTNLFSGVELNNSRLYPSETLCPATSLYPSGAALSSEKSLYSKLWADEGNVQKWRYLIITYKGLNEDQQEEDFTLQRTVNADGTQDYNMSDNWIFRNLVWTAEDVGTYADAMVTKMQQVTWFPFEMWCAGLPYIETGDEIEISMGTETYKTYVLQRQLNGIQNLQDTYINGTLDIF